MSSCSFHYAELYEPKKAFGENLCCREVKMDILGVTYRTFQGCPTLFRAQEPKAPVTYCDHALSGVRRPSVVRRPLDNLHFQLLLQNRLIDFDETWYGWSTQGPLQVLLFFGQICPGADPGRGQNRSRVVPFFKELLLQTRRLQQQT